MAYLANKLYNSSDAFLFLIYGFLSRDTNGFVCLARAIFSICVLVIILHSIGFQ